MKPEELDEKYGAIIIGSGIGGLTTAVLLARLAGKKVLILERHFKPGGYTHVFRRQGKFEWDVGLHYVGGMKPGEITRRLMDFVTAGKVDWQALPVPFDNFHYPEHRFGLKGVPAEDLTGLKKIFPESARELDHYFSALSKVSRYSAVHFVLGKIPLVGSLARLFTAEGEKLARSTTREVLEKYISNPQLRALLSSQWPDHGLPPARSSFFIQSLIWDHYSRGAWYPVGGSGKIAEYALEQVAAAGGHCLINATADEILTEGDRVTGVRFTWRPGKKKEVVREIQAGEVYSGVGADQTFLRLLSESVPLSFRDEVRRARQTDICHLDLYIGFRDSVRELGFQGGNYWLYTGYDHDQMVADQDAINGEIRLGFLSMGSLNNPEAEGVAGQFLTMARYEDFAAWENSEWKKRGPEYQALKEKITNNMLHFLEEQFPGIGAHVEYTELSTPLSTVDMAGHRHGNIYGIPATPDRLSYAWIQPRTPLKGLYLTGADAGGHGIVGALMGGMMSAAATLGYPRIFRGIS